MPFDRFENENLSEDPAMASVVASMHAMLRTQFDVPYPPTPPPPPPLPCAAAWETDTAVAFGVHAPAIRLDLNKSTATWPRSACDTIALIERADAPADAAGVDQYWVVVAASASGDFYIDIGFCAPDVDVSGRQWVGFQRGKGFVLRRGGLFADSWVLVKPEQGQPYPGPDGKPLAYGAGSNVTAWHNGTHLRFGVDRVGTGVGWGPFVKPSKPMPANAVGCAGVCRGATIAMQGCVGRVAHLDNAIEDKTAG